MKPQYQDLRLKLNLMRKLKSKKLKSEVFIVSLPSTSVEQIKLNQLYGLPIQCRDFSNSKATGKKPQFHARRKQKVRYSHKKDLLKKCRQSMQSKSGLKVRPNHSRNDSFILEHDDSWPIFIEEEGVMSLKELCISVAQRNFRKLQTEIKTLPFEIKWDIYKNF